MDRIDYEKMAGVMLHDLGLERGWELEHVVPILRAVATAAAEAQREACAAGFVESAKLATANGSYRSAGYHHRAAARVRTTKLITESEAK